MSYVTRKKLTDDEIKEQKKQQDTRAKLSRAARRGGKINTKEGKVEKSNAKTKESRSQKKMATVRKSRQ